MKYYLDTSAFCALYTPEAQSKKMLTFIETHEVLFISRLVETEFYSALAIKIRTKHIDKVSFQKITQLFNAHLAEGRYQKLYMSDEVFSQAITYLKSNITALKTLDALHLSCAALNKTTLITSDRILYQSAHQLHLSAQLM